MSQPFRVFGSGFSSFFPFLAKFGGGRDLINAGGVREGNAFSKGYLRDMWIFPFFFFYEVLIILEGKSFFIVSRGDYFCFFLFDFVY